MRASSASPPKPRARQAWLLVYPLDEKYQRLDLYLADKPRQVPAKDQLSLLRQTAETVSYAHRNKVVHRGLTPHAVLVRSLPDGGAPRVLVGDWQSAGAAAGTGLTGLSSVSASPALGTQESQPSYPERRGATLPRPVALDVDRRMAEAFQAPEGVWNPDADRVRIDVFALGALAYYVLSGAMPAADRTTLRERLNRDRGLDLAVDLPQVTPALRALVLDATRPAVTERLPDVRAFLDRLEAAEAAAEPGEDVIDPLEAAPGAVIDGRFRLQRRLGTGSTATRQNPGWWYRRVHGELLGLGVKVAASTVWEILREAGIDPAPERSSTTWAGFPAFSGLHALRELPARTGASEQTRSKHRCGKV